MVKNIFEMEDHDKPCILMQIWSQSDKKRVNDVKTDLKGAVILNI